MSINCMEKCNDFVKCENFKRDEHVSPMVICNNFKPKQPEYKVGDRFKHHDSIYEIAVYHDDGYFVYDLMLHRAGSKVYKTITELVESLQNV